MRVILLFVLLFLANCLQAQLPPVCPSNSTPGADNCLDVCLYCNLNGYTGNTGGYTPDDAPDFCGTITNNQWLGFIANGTNATFTVTPSNCNNGDGLQLALYPACSEAPLACNPGSPGGGSTPVTVNAPLIPGEDYFLMVNGRDGDACDFTVTVSPSSAVQQPPLGATPVLNGSATACPGAVLTYSIPNGVTNAVSYKWTAPAGALINGQPGPLTLPEASGKSVQVLFGSTSGQVCVQPLGACSAGTVACRTVVVQSIPPTILPPVTLCAEDAPYQLPWGDVASVSGIYQTTLASYLGCDSVVRQQVTFKPPIIRQLGPIQLCPGIGCFQVGGVDYCSPGTYAEVLQSFQGCDSTVVFTIVNMTAPRRGVVFWDLNADGAFNGNDFFASNIQVITSSQQVAQTTSNGVYLFPTLQAGDTIRVVPPANAGVVDPPYQVYDTTQPSCYIFALTPALGRVFYDLDNNQVFDPGVDVPAADVVVKTSAGPLTLTGVNGLYAIPGISAGDTIRVELPASAQGVAPDFRIFQSGSTTGYDFALVPAGIPAKGRVFWDVDGDGQFSAGDAAAPAVVVDRVGAGQSQALSGFDGRYNHFPIEPGDTLRIQLPADATGVQPLFYTYQAGQSDGYDFALAFDPGYDLDVDLTNFSVFRPGFTTTLQLTAKNRLGTPVSGVQVCLTLPNFLEILSTTPMPDLMQGDTLCWNIGTLNSFQTQSVQIAVKTPATTPLGTTVSIPSWITPLTSDDNPANNSFTLVRPVVGSYDPNDKQVEPMHVLPAQLDAGKRLSYTIRFQNTGNFPADFVRIADTLSPLIDVGSLRFIASSHPCEWYFPAPNVVEFIFPNINLPDSVSNEPESHGFVKFSVLPKPGLDLGDVVGNFCDIFFDFNPPIRTNTALTQVVYFLPGNGLPPNTGGLSARPNPAAFRLYCSWSTPAPAPGRLRLFNTLGLPAAELDVPEGETSLQVEVSYLPEGVYLLVLDAGDLYLHRRVVVSRSGPVRKE